jgi:hypothetical protein
MAFAEAPLQRLRGGGVFSPQTEVPIDTRLPYFSLVNGDPLAQTVTLAFRYFNDNQPDAVKTMEITLQPGAAQSFPTENFSTASVSSAVNDLYWFHSSVPMLGAPNPNVAPGGGSVSGLIGLTAPGPGTGYAVANDPCPASGTGIFQVNPGGGASANPVVIGFGLTQAEAVSAAQAAFTAQNPIIGYGTAGDFFVAFYPVRAGYYYAIQISNGVIGINGDYSVQT